MRPYYQDEYCTIYHGDCTKVLPQLAAVDLVLTDPPYGIGQKWAAHPMIGKNGSSRLWGNGETWDNAVVDCAIIQRAISAGAAAIVWGGHYYTLPPSRCWLVWDKMQTFTGADAELAWTNLSLPVRVFRMSRIEAYCSKAESRKQHPTEKPIQLMRWCLSLHEGDTVLDPFMGSGTTLRAAKDLQRKVIGIEIEERYCEIAAERLQQEVMALA